MRRSERAFLPDMRSVHTRLLFWNVGALALILSLLGGLLRYTLRENLLHSVDRELALRLEPFRDRPEPPPHDGNRPPEDRNAPGDHGPPRGEPPWDKGPNGGRGPNDGRRDGRRPDDDKGPGFPMMFGHRPGMDIFKPREGGNQTMRPRAFDTEGHPLFPFNQDALWDNGGFQIALTGKENYSRITKDEEVFRVFSAPLRSQGKVVAVAQVAHPLTDVNRAVSDMDRTLLTLIPAALLMAGAGGAFLTRRALMPVQQMQQVSEKIGAKDLSQRLPVIGNDDFARLADTINGMLTRLEAAFHHQQELVNQQRRFTADASHELRTPLTIIKANTSLAMTGTPSPQDYRESIEEIDHASDTMSRLVGDLLMLAHADADRLGQNRNLLALREVLSGCLSRVRHKTSATLTLECPEEIVFGNEDELSRLFVNLLENAARYTPAEGKITVTAQRDGQRVRVTVADTGIGIAQEHLPHLGERFYRVDTSRSRPDGGSGLGLSICKSIVAAHGGALTIRSVVGKGTAVEVVLPTMENQSLDSLPCS